MVIKMYTNKPKKQKNKKKNTLTHTQRTKKIINHANSPAWLGLEGA